MRQYTIPKIYYNKNRSFCFFYLNGKRIRIYNGKSIGENIYPNKLKKKDQVLNEDPPVIYSGSLERVDFGEKNDDKGFYILEIDKNKPQGNRLKYYKKIKVNARKFNEIKIKIL